MNDMKNNSGVAFVMSVLMMVLFTSLGLGYLISARTDLKIAKNNKDALLVMYHAESALEHSIGEILNGVDADGDGLGNIPLKDINSDGVMDYSAAYNTGTGMIMANGQVGAAGTTLRTVQAKVTPKQWTGAVQVGQNFAINAPAGGTINGNVDAKGGIYPNIGLYVVNGTITANNATLVIPTPSFPAYGGVANFFYGNNCPGLSLTPAAGIHMVTGDCLINGGGVSSFVLNGSLIVTGTLTIQNVTTIVITPSGNNPAIVAGVDFVLTSTNNATFNKLVYAGRDIRLTTLAFLTRVNDGAYVAGRDLVFTNVPNSLLTFNSSLNPPFFTGDNGLTVNYWKGNQ